MKVVTFALSLMLAACAGRPARAPQVKSISSAWERVLSLNEGQTITINDAGFRLGFVIPVEDSRCPTDVTCIQQGRFLGKFIFESLISKGGPNQAFVFLMSTEEGCSQPECGPFIHTGQPQGELGSVYYTVVIEKVLPERLDGQEILEPYRVWLRISN